MSLLKYISRIVKKNLDKLMVPNNFIKVFYLSQYDYLLSMYIQ